MRHPWKPHQTFHPSLYLLGAAALLLTGAMCAHAQETDAATAETPLVSPIYTTLYDFTVSDRGYPSGPLALGRDGNLYGIQYGNEIFKITPQGVETELWLAPTPTTCNNGMTLGTDGYFYGTCISLYNSSSNPTGGFNGAAFKYDPSKGQAGFTTLYQWPSTGVAPQQAPLTEGTDGNFYSVTCTGGGSGLGAFYQLTPAGVFTVLHSFLGGSSNEGSCPYGPLTLGIDGNFYGTTSSGGSTTNSNGGSVYKMTPAGEMTVLYAFAGGTTGPNTPYGGVIQGTDKNFYGTTVLGGTSTQGTIFKVTKKGAMTVLHDFEESVDLAGFPTLGLTQGTDGNLYGAATGCYAGGCQSGGIFETSTKGSYSTIQVLAIQPGGYSQNIAAPLLLHPNGLFYGTTQQGGSQSGSNEYHGSFFSLGVGLSPAAHLLPALGATGTTVEIFGQGLSTATAVAFKGTAATFTKVSDTYLTAVVPGGAKSGSVTVTTSSGTLTSNVTFTVLKSSRR